MLRCNLKGPKCASPSRPHYLGGILTKYFLRKAYALGTRQPMVAPVRIGFQPFRGLMAQSDNSVNKNIC